jgi:hypothetical protein
MLHGLQGLGTDFEHKNVVEPISSNALLESQVLSVDALRPHLPRTISATICLMSYDDK